jgi:hypothetical protein
MKQVLSLKQIKAELTDSDRELAKDDSKNKFSKFSNNNNRSQTQLNPDPIFDNVVRQPQLPYLNIFPRHTISIQQLHRLISIHILNSNKDSVLPVTLMEGTLNLVLHMVMGMV